MGLPEVWFVAIAVLWTGFFVLEGFDFGVGMLHSVVARSETEQRVAINTIGPFWDGNEVWLVVGAAGIFAAFPSWYATWLSAGYLAILVLLVALILRGVSFEFRGKVDTGRWRRAWSLALSIGSLVTPFILGIALGDLLVGLPVDANQEFTGSFWALFTGYGVWTGVTVVLLCLVHGAAFLGLRTTGALRERARALGVAFAWAAMAAVVVFGLWTLNIVDVGPVTYGALSLAPVAVLVALVSLRAERERRAFVATTLAMAGTVGSLFGSLYPDVLVSSTDPAYNLTVDNSASGHYALVVMTVVVAVVLPVVLAYQAYSYVVFRHRVGAPAVGTGDTSSPLPQQRTDAPEIPTAATSVPPRRR
ncbi:MAG TPA: cytochrome d ubiquinol oxidase subunit II [Nocardioidaceae bacterium]|jgi:cytochrome d ubiquinol oxidase subunit II|nr:cytochrome d ubiquinol oxidase subunit II [Nocardioidaceae bacterium]